MTNKEIGKRIHDRRQELDLTLQEIASEIGLAKSTILRYENGDIVSIKLPVIEAIARVLDVDPAYLLGKSDDPKPRIKNAQKTRIVSSEEWIERYGIPVSGMIPIVGCIRAGMPILAEENIEGYEPTTMSNPEDYFYLRVSGNSMLNANIFDGALVLIHKQSYANSGQIVACRVNGDEATLKRYKPKGNIVILMPENSDYEPIVVPAEDFNNGSAEILGVAKEVTTPL